MQRAFEMPRLWGWENGGTEISVVADTGQRRCAAKFPKKGNLALKSMILYCGNFCSSLANSGVPEG